MPNLINPKCSKELNDEELEKVSGGDGDSDITIKYKYTKGSWFVYSANMKKTRVFYIQDYAGADSSGPLYSCLFWVEKMPGHYGNPNSGHIGESTLGSYTQVSIKPAGINY